MSDWLADVATLADQGEPCVLITVVSTRGSVPREAGTRMVISRDRCAGTIGGGHLEYRAIELARRQLTDAGRPETFSERFPLGASLGQCCGGLVYLLFERLATNGHPWLDFVRAHDRKKQTVVMVTQLLPDTTTQRDIASVRRLVVSEQASIGELVGVQPFAMEHARRRLWNQAGNTVETLMVDRPDAKNLLPVTSAQPGTPLRGTPLLFEVLQPDAFAIYLFGAGHVGQAIVNVLSQLPCRIFWIDSRADQFPDTLPDNVQCVISDQPDSEIDAAASGSFVLIMTHSHALDEIICQRALQRGDLAYCGLIGSESKRRNFVRRFEARGMPAQSIARLTCPIGIPGLPGKHPGEIAISVSAELLLVKESGKQVLAIDAQAPSPALQSA